MVHTNAVLAKLVAQEPSTAATTPITTPTLSEVEDFEVDLIIGPKFEFISLDRLVNNCLNEIHRFQVFVSV